MRMRASLIEPNPQGLIRAKLASQADSGQSVAKTGNYAVVVETSRWLVKWGCCVNERSVPGRRKAQGQNRNAASQDSLSGCSCRGGFWSRRGLVRGIGLSRTFAGFARQHLGDLASEVCRCEGLLDERHAWNQHVSPEKLAAVAGHVQYFRSRSKQADFLGKSWAGHPGHNDICKKEID